MAGEIDDDEDDSDMPLSEEGLDDLEGDGDGEEENVPLDPRERAARSLEIRRAIESRIEERRLRSDLDYLESDGDSLEDDELDS
jgi:hypothetical protein